MLVYFNVQQMALKKRKNIYHTTSDFFFNSLTSPHLLKITYYTYALLIHQDIYIYIFKLIGVAY